MIGKEPENERERRAEDLNRDEQLRLIDAIRDLEHDIERLEKKVDAGDDQETLLSEIDLLRIRLCGIERRARGTDSSSAGM